MPRTNLPSLPLLLVLVFFSPFVSGLVSGQEPSPGFNTPWRNADGSPKLALEFAGGYNTTAGGLRPYQGPGWNYRMGGGYRLSRRFAALLEYNYDHFRIPQPLVNEVTYYSGYSYAGTVHLWSATMEPTFEVLETEHYGAYLVGGGGFYRKVTTFLPICPKSESPCYFVPADTPHLSNNAGGLNLGIELARRISDRNNAKFVIGARYVWVDNSPNPKLGYPPANYRTGYIPLSGGVRW